MLRRARLLPLTLAGPTFSDREAWDPLDLGQPRDVVAKLSQRVVPCRVAKERRSHVDEDVLIDEDGCSDRHVPVRDSRRVDV